MIYWIAGAAIAAAVLIQSVWVVKTSTDLAGKKVWVDRNRDAVSRSADVTYGADFLGYIDFLREQIPPQATVIDTRTFGLPQYDLYTFLQYFLIPRTIVPLTNSTCPNEADINKCILNLSGPETYFMYGANFKVSAGILGTLKDLPFGQGLGVLAPQGKP